VCLTTLTFRQNPFTFLFSLAGSLLVLFVILPLASTILKTSFSAFAQTLVDAEVLSALGLTFGSAALATGLALLTGVPLAYLLARYSFRGKHLVVGLMDLPVVMPHTAAGIALLMVFGSKGVLGRWLSPYGIYFTENMAGIVVAMLFVSLPYLVNMSREAFRLVDVELEQAALVDGANNWQAFWEVTLPIAWRGVAGGALMMWARGISEFGAVIILTYHPMIVPVLIYERFAGFGLAAAQPVAVILILTVLIVFGLLRLVLVPEHK
jgi:molybdate/tungstate transport system permease protein